MIQKHKAPHTPIHNHLLDALPTIDYKRILPLLEEVPLKRDAILYDVGDKLKYVYFVNSGIISLLGAMDGSATLELGVIGPEGMAGLPLFIGLKTSRIRSVVQAPGSALRMKKANFTSECGNGGALSGLLLRFTFSMMFQVWQSALCFRSHTVEERMVRRLLMTSDRVESNEFKMTHDLLSRMMGVRREAISLAALSLKKKEIITYARGCIQILDRKRLEAAACKCYSIIHDEEKSR